MANTLNSLAQTTFQGVQAVRRQATGIIAGVSQDFDAEPVPLNEYIDVPINSAAANADATPSNVSSTGSDSTTSTARVQLTKRRKNSFHVTGDDAKTINRMGFATWYQNKLVHSIAALVDEIEGDLAGLHVKASYALGTPGTTPFGSNIDVMADLYRYAVEAGVPREDLTLALNPLAAANIRKRIGTGVLGGADSLKGELETGVILNLHRFNIRESGQIKTHTAGAGSGYLANGGEAIGATSITVDTGSGAVVEGDIITHADDTVNKYVASGDIATNELPLNGSDGLKIAVANNSAITLGADHAANMAFHRRAIALAIRPTAMPPGGDAADEAMIASDPDSNLSFLILRYGQYLQATYEVHATWGYSCIEPEAVWKLAG